MIPTVYRLDDGSDDTIDSAVLLIDQILIPEPGTVFLVSLGTLIRIRKKIKTVMLII